MRMEMDTWILFLSDMTPRQRKIIRMSTSKHRFVSGHSGSGKTEMLLHRAAYLAETYNVPSESYRIFVFTDMAKEYVKPFLKFLGLPEKTTATLDQWCCLFYEHHVSRDLPRTYKNLRIDYSMIRERVLSVLKEKKELHNKLEFALVDDAQDLPPEGFEILRLAARHITVFGDFQQKIVENETSEHIVREILRLEPGKEVLAGVYRNTPQIAWLASYFISDVALRRDFLDQISSSQKVKEQPFFYIAPLLEREIELMAETVQMRQSMNEKVGIIVPTDRLLHDTAERLMKRRVRVEKVTERDAQNVIHGPYDLRNLVPKITTYRKAKGLAFDTVFLPRLVEDAFSNIKEETRLKMLYMGMTRARQWVYLSTVKGNEIREISILKAAKERGHLLIL